MNAAPADYRALPGPLWDTDGTSGKWAAKRVAVVPRIRIEDGGKAWTTNLVVGFTSIRPYLKDPGTGTTLAPLGNGLAIAEKYGLQKAFHLATWPTEPPFGPGVTYEIPYAVPSVDEVTGLVGVPVKNLSDNSITWFVLDLSKPQSPQTIAKIKDLSQAAALYNGVLFAMDKSGKARAYQVVKGVEMAGECAEVPDDGPFRVRLSANEVLPTQTTTWHEAPPHLQDYNRVRVIVNGKPLTNYVFTLTAQAATGGHSHFTQANNRPIGTMTPANATTDANGRAESVFEAPIVGGDVVLTVTEAGGALVRRTILVRVPGLMELPAGAHYDRGVGSNQTRHANYFYGRPELVRAIQNIANQFWELYSDLDPQIRFNDMSLVSGGNFRTGSDGGDCDAEGQRHVEHKYGLNVDGSRQLRLRLRRQAGAGPTPMDVTLSIGGTQTITYYTADGQSRTVVTGTLWDRLNRLYEEEKAQNTGAVWENTHWHLRKNWE